jgi:tetratricopeptide (TPR) repeat protein
MATKVILLLMIKNESRIIERCLEGALPHVDAVSVLDTGSTDNTVEVAKKVLEASGKPYLIKEEPFIDFGKSRTRSFEVAQELCTTLAWDAETTYGFAVDADMVIVPSAEFRSHPLTLNGYSVIQANGVIKYYNMRLMKLSYPWKCIGATHEYWSGDPTGKIPYEVLYIDDRNDGGCKSDKFERDVRLLSAEIAEDPNNGRAHFYLGQSLKDLGRFDEAIKMFKRRIELGGWYEEVWYAHYQIAKCHEHAGRIHKMEQWMNRAFDFHPRRAEPLYHLCRYFREHSQHYKSFHYYLKGRHIPYPKDDVLFIEDNVYNGMFDYENTILACYVTGKSKQDAAVDLVQYLNKRTPFFVDNVWDNLHYYVEALNSERYRGEYSRLLFPSHEEYHVSSCSLLPYSGSDPNRRYVVNTRYVNYTIDPSGGYHMPDGVVRTKNGRVFLNKDYQPTEPIGIMHEEYERHPSNIEGLEDVRLFRTSPAAPIQFTSSSKNATADGRIVIASGQYDPILQRMQQIKVIEAPRPSGCEKNWLFVPEEALETPQAIARTNMIYGWNPLEIGAIDPETNQLQIHTTYPTPAFFNRLRGSAAPVPFGNKLWAVVHYVRYSTPRVYYHCIVQFDEKTMRPEQISAPFCFRRLAIEYCLGFHVADDGVATFLFSENDSDPGMMRVPLHSLRWLHV